MNIAVVLAAGRGKRMNADMPKQYLQLHGKPLFMHSVLAFENCRLIDGIILVTGEEERNWCEEYLLKTGGLKKVISVIAGGKERYDSVYAALREAGKHAEDARSCFVLIHDGARPMVDEEIIERNLACAKEKGCAVTGMPVKDTIKIAAADGLVEDTPRRDRVWQVQTPQTFRLQDIAGSYEKMMAAGEAFRRQVTDDAMVMEHFGNGRVYMCRGSYRNLKITTPDDLVLAEQLMQTAEVKSIRVSDVKKY